MSICALLSVGLREDCGAEESGSNTIYVGAILPLSGDAASIGEAIKNGIELAYGKLNGQTKSRIKIIYEDDACIAKNTVSAFHKLIAVHKVDALISAASSPSSAIAPLADKAKVPLVAVASDPEIVNGRKFVFNLWVTPEEEIRAMIPEMLKRGYKKIARITSTHQGPISVNAEFDRQNLGRFKIVLDQEYPMDNKDFKDYLSRLRVETGVDAVFLNLFPGHLSSFAKQIKQMQIDLPLFGLEMLDDSNEIKAAQGALAGAWYVNASDAQPEFLEEYREKYPNASLMTAANGHDALKLIAIALESENLKTPRQTISAFLHNLKDFKGALGTYSASGDNRFTLPAAVKVVP